jgi:hypothetical protein
MHGAGTSRNPHSRPSSTTIVRPRKFQNSTENKGVKLCAHCQNQKVLTCQRDLHSNRDVS